ncbi:FAD-dependent oxidoreductase [Methylobacterium sp. NEAU 140]|uniref:FAD-dependent oxidoreductase n=1 Tax=Methylobacterium sp. NEAU 140 TaxID=3064945 RepID=UPI0027340526|nr:FAD-dependent oxidoreductase [Methylobacterium sp. NEAU 140]MDP4026493.1 FAD-dependent oxidoreductase [Methylobacterium sp. NEAU 140]
MAHDQSINVISQELENEIFGGNGRRARRARPALTYKEAAREIPVFAETDVLVIGGGPAGTSAAIAAGRVGADVMLVERYNHLGGLSTGGLVIWIDRMTDWNGKQVIAGFAADVFERLPKDAIMGPPRSAWGTRDAATAAYWSHRASAFQGVVTWSPTIDPEALKTVSMQMILEQKVRLTLHSWAVQPIVEDGVIRGAIFESKEGRQAILAKVVVDTTGDADLLSRAGVVSEADIDKTDIHHCMNTAFLLGGVDMERWAALRADKDAYSEFGARGRARIQSFERPQFGWRNDVALFMGPRLSGYSAIDVEDLTEVEIRSRQLTVQHLEFYRAHAPGFENAFLMLGAPQVGVRHSRRFAAANKVTRAQWDEGKVWDDEIGVSTSLAPKWKNISVPYSSLVPLGIDGALGAGRHVACDASSHTFLREIPQCWMTGQAAGVAAAIAAGTRTRPRHVEPRLVQRELLKQGAYLSSGIERSVSTAASAAE